MNVHKKFNHALLPFSNLLKKNNNIINLSLIILLLLLISPINHFFGINLKEKIKDKTNQLMISPFFMTCLSLLVYTVYVSNDPMMFSLLMVIIYHLM